MSTDFFNELRTELEQGASQKEHPFHYFTLGTVGLEDLARLRTIKLREVSHSPKLTFYSDKRSKKILHIKENPKVSLLFYHPKKLLQLKIEGLAVVHRDADLIRKRWKGVHPESRKDYTSSAAPGSAIDSPEAVEFLKDGDYFCVVEVSPFKIEYLKLQHPNHIKVRFTKRQMTDDWISEFLVP